SVLLSVFPYQFYAFLALLTIPIVIWTRRDYGPMRRVQKQYLDDLEKRTEHVTEMTSVEIKAGTDERLGIFLWPLGVMLFM
ncbi:MAG: hypothetical protein GWN47_08955, partial [Woeseiaceae bacterium]|nr:hypothetical protein [Woeseiaceae bacterium]